MSQKKKHPAKGNFKLPDQITELPITRQHLNHAMRMLTPIMADEPTDEDLCQFYALAGMTLHWLETASGSDRQNILKGVTAVADQLEKTRG